MRKFIRLIAPSAAILATWLAPSARAQLMDASAISPHPEFAHSQIVAVSTPESSTAAVALCGLFAAALIARHFRLRRNAASRLAGSSS
jgi:hypothetical protein